MSKKENLVVKEIKEIVSTLLDDMKAKDVLLINLEGKTDLASFMYIASGTSNRNVYAIASKLIEKLKHAGIHCVSEGLESSEWVVVDIFDVIVHIFKEDVRQYYKLEEIWQ